MISVVPLARAHIAACASIVDAAPLMRRYGYRGAVARGQLAREIDRDGRDLRVALAGGEVAGFTWIVEEGGFARSAYLRLILVGEGRAGGGVGGALMDDLERRHLEPAGIVLLCSSENEGARRFYERRGYAQVGSIPGYVLPDLDELIFFKSPS